MQNRFTLITLNANLQSTAIMLIIKFHFTVWFSRSHTSLSCGLACTQ